MGTFFRILFKTIAGVLGLLIVLILVLTFIGVKVDLSFMREGVEVSAKKALGREVSIAGPVELEFSNWPALEVSDVTVANVAGASQPDLLNAGLVRLQIGIFPLLKGEIDIADITAHNVTLNLETDAEGEPNWVFGEPGEKKSAQPDPVEAETGEEDGKLITFAGLDHLSLKQIAVNYHDAALNKALSFELDSMVGTAAEGEPMMLDFEGHVQNKTYDLELHGGSISDLLDKDEPWNFNLKGEIVGKEVAAKGDMLLRGHDPEINLAMGVRDIDVGEILSALGLVEGMQASLGDVGIKFTIKGDSLNEIMQQSSMLFAIKGGSWNVMVPNSEASFDIDNLSGNILVEQGNAITMKLDGTIDKTPVKLFITGAPLVEYVKDQKEIPLTIDAELLKSQISFASTVQLPITNRDISLSLKLTSERIDNFNEMFRLDLPPIGPVSLESKLDITKQGYDLSTLNVKVGESSLNGSLKLNTSLKKPKLDISLISQLIQLDDFDTGETDEAAKEQSEADAEKESTEQASDEKTEEKDAGDRKNLLSYEVLNAFDADIKIEAKDVKSGEDDLGSALMKIGLKDTRLAVEPLAINVPGGKVQVNMDYTPSPTDVTFNMTADIEEFDVGVMVRRKKPESDMGGKFTLDAELHSQAPDLVSVMENANGHFDFALVPKNFSSGIIDLWAVNLLSAIMDKSTEKDKSEINCVVVRFGIKDGLMEEKAIYLDTTNMRIAGKSEINFKTQELDIKMAPKAKNPEFFSVAIPIKIKGSFDDFGLKIGVVRMTGQVISFITSPVHVPIRRVFTEEEPDDGIDACKAAWTRTGEEKKDSN
jgi:uncharacterized protein involved in outer membrane biogenesis